MSIVVNSTIFWMESTSAVQTGSHAVVFSPIRFHINWRAPYISISIKIHQDKGDVFRAVGETASTVLGASAVASPIRGDLKFHSAPTPLPMAASSDDPGPGGEKRFEPWLDWKSNNFFDWNLCLHIITCEYVWVYNQLNVASVVISWNKINYFDLGTVWCNAILQNSSALQVPVTFRLAKNVYIIHSNTVFLLFWKATPLSPFGHVDWQLNRYSSTILYTVLWCPLSFPLRKLHLPFVWGHLPRDSTQFFRASKAHKLQGNFQRFTVKYGIVRRRNPEWIRIGSFLLQYSTNSIHLSGILVGEFMFYLKQL